MKSEKTLATLKNSLLIILLIIVSFLSSKTIINSVNERNTSKTETNPSSLLKHANTLYWYARANGNTNHEFEKSNRLAKTAQKALFKQDSSKRNDLIYASELINSTQEYIDSDYLTVNNRFPLYADMMGINTLIDEDQPKDQLEKLSTQKVLDKLLNSVDFNSSKPIAKIPYFAIVKHSNNELKENAVEYININSNIYTISDHELSLITGVNNIDTKELIKDSILLNKVTSHFNSKKLIIIEVLPQDIYEGIHYYGAKAYLYNDISAARYVESFVKNRDYNNLFDFKIPLLILFLCVIIIGGILYNISRKNNKKITIPTLLVNSIIAIVINIICIEVVAHFIAPINGDYSDSDEVNLWSNGIALSFSLIPAFLTYVIIGKLDNLIDKFDSKLDDKESLFAIIFPTLSTFSIALVYYSINRYGISQQIFLGLITFPVAFFNALLISNYWHKTRNLPYKSSMLQKLYSWTMLLTSITYAFLFISSYFSIFNLENSLNTTLYLFFIPFVLLYLFDFIFYEKINRKNQEETNQLKIENNFDYIENEHEKIALKKLNELKSVVIYGPDKIGKTSFVNKIAQEIIKEHKIEHIIKIDFEKQSNNKKINYEPFLEGFGNYLPQSTFNDKAEGAKKSGNIIGKIISSIASAGDLLIDNSEAKPADTIKVSKVLVNTINQFKECVIIFENINLSKNENTDLLTQFLNDIRIAYLETKNKKKHYFIYSSLEGFHIKKHFENSVEDIIILNKKEKCPEIYSLVDHDFSPFLKFQIPQNYLSKYLTKLNFSIFDLNQLSKTYTQNDRNTNPYIINKTFEILKQQNFIDLKDKNHSINKDKWKNNFQLPDIKIDYESIQNSLNSLPQTLLDFLRECSYCTLNDGQFEVELIYNIIKIDPLKALNYLRQLEAENLVFDLKDGWYSFNDITLVHYFKRDEEFSELKCSLLSKEIYLRWINYYTLKIDTIILNKKTIETLKKLKEIAQFFSNDKPIEMFSLNSKIGTIFNQFNLSLLREAQVCFENANLIIEKYPNLVTEETKYNFLITCRLRNLRLQNSWDSEIVSSILEKKELIIKVLPELKNEILQTEYLKYAKSSEYLPSTAIQKINEIENILKNNNLNSLEQLRYNFSILLLSPKKKSHLQTDEDNLNVLKNLEREYIKLINDIENKEKLKNEAFNEGIYQELLNSLGSLYCDDLIVNKSIHKPQVDEYYKEGITVLFKRIQIECTKIKITSLLSDEQSLIEIIRQFQLEENKYQIDRKGLAYTFNFLTRLICNKNNGNLEYEFKPEVKEYIMVISKYAFAINIEVNDIAGLTIAASFYGKLESINDKENAFEIFKIGFAFNCYNDNVYQANRAISNLNELGLAGKYKEEIDSYKKIMLERHLLRHFSDVKDTESLNLLKNEHIIKDTDDLARLNKIIGSKFSPEFVTSPKLLIEKVNNKIKAEKIVLTKKFTSEYYELEFEDSVGFYNIVDLKTLDEIQIKSIQKENRNGYEFNTISNYSSKTKTIIVIVDSNNEIKTIFPGLYAPKFPNNIIGNNEEKEDAEHYWKNHVIIK